MGNVGARAERKSLTVLGDGEEIYPEYVDRLGSQEMMLGQSPPHSPMLQNATNDDDTIHERGIPTLISWSYGGREIAVEGSWDNWKTRKLLQRSGKEHVILEVLPPGVYQFRFIVDGERRHTPEIEWVHDDLGNAYNVLDVQEYFPDKLDGIASFEPPLSPDSSYNNMQLEAKDYAKEPPLLPAHLQQTILNTAPYMDGITCLSRPQHVLLNHLYMKRVKSDQSVLALGMTNRFRAKYVTVVLYKAL